MSPRPRRPQPCRPWARIGRSKNRQVGRTHGWRLINSGVIPVVRLSPRCIRVPRQALEALIAVGGVQGTRLAQNEPVPLKLRA
jgi:hypothetical protein